MNTNEKAYESEFTGGALANLGIGFVTFFVTLITLGIAYPFMLCWRLKWVNSNTYINGRQLTFDGNGAQLLGKYLLWILLCIVTLGIYAIFWMPLNMSRWETKHTHFADGEKGESEFDAHIWQFFGVRFLAGFVTLITLGLGSYWAHCYLQRWCAKHEVIDGSRLAFDGTAWEYFGKCIVWTLLSVVTLGIYLIWFSVHEMKWTVSHTHIAG